MRPFTLVLPYFRNPGMMKVQLDRLRSYPDDLRANVSLIVVDDGSPKEALEAFEAPDLVSVRTFRIDVDVRWNWLAARNIGHHFAATDWRLWTDIDHLVPEDTARWIVHGKANPKNIYRFSRVNYPKGDPYKPHPNSWLMTREMFDATGGYDERFSGHYGTDGMFRDRCAKAAQGAGGIVFQLPYNLERVDREVIHDASTRHYERKAPEDKEAVPRIRREIEASGDLTPRRLTFPFHETTAELVK